jgi:hypothetical protein
LNRILQFDSVELNPSKITGYDHDVFGPVTVFKDVVIARAIVHKYDDGMAYKPGRELENAYWTATGMWATSGGHPSAAVISSRDEIHGRTVNVRFSRSLNDPKSGRPMSRGILADLEVFNDRVPPALLSDMKNGKKNDVSIGFFFDYDDTTGVVDDEEDQALRGTTYDYVQRNITINHVAFGIDKGRCSMPYCGIGADGMIREVTGDPFADYKDFADCVSKNKDKRNPEAYCASIEQKIKEARKKKDAEPRTEKERAMAHFNISEEEWEALSEEERAEKIAALPARGSKEKDFKLIDDNKLSMKQTVEEAKIYLRDILRKLDSIEFAPDHIVEEEHEGNLTNVTLSERAKRYFNISEDDWLALTETEKEDYISRLPPEKPMEGQTNKDEEAADGESGECEDCDEDDYDEFIVPHLDEDSVLTLEQRKALPDEAYAYIEDDCTEDGVTPQRCRHIPIHDKAHVKAAIEALEDTENTLPYKEDAKTGVCTAAEKFKFYGVVICGSVKQKRDSVDEIARAKELLGLR